MLKVQKRKQVTAFRGVKVYKNKMYLKILNIWVWCAIDDQQIIEINI